MSHDSKSRYVRRRSQFGPLVFLAVLIVLMVCGLLAFFLLRKGASEQPAVQPFAKAVPAPAALSQANVVSYDQAEINRAVAKGVAYLKKEVLARARLYHRSELADVAPGNAHLGALALAGLALLECNVPPDDSSVQIAAESIRNAADQLHATYTLATAILFLDRLQANFQQAKLVRNSQNDRSAHGKLVDDRDLICSLALRLMARQDVGGFWGYGLPRVSKGEEKATLQLALAGKTPGKTFGYSNVSNSQFAALALWAAKRHGVPVRPALEAVAHAARAQQTPEGTWHYDRNLAMKHTSACAGLIFLALERGLQEENIQRSGGKTVDPKLNKNILDDPAVAKAMNYLGKMLAKPPVLSAQKKEERHQNAQKIKEYYEHYENNKGVSPPPVGWSMDFAFSGTIIGADSWGDLYLLWSLERVGVIYDVKTIQPKGGKDWYLWGSEIIVANQKEEGQWEDRFPGVPDTCFALLFLKRANIAKDLTDKFRALMQSIRRPRRQSARSQRLTGFIVSRSQRTVRQHAPRGSLRARNDKPHWTYAISCPIFVHAHHSFAHRSDAMRRPSRPRKPRFSQRIAGRLGWPGLCPDRRRRGQRLRSDQRG